MRNKKCLVIFLIMLVFLFTACSDSSVTPMVEQEQPEEVLSNPKPGGKIALATTSPIILNPLDVENDEEKTVISLLYDGLIKIDAQGKVQPHLAKAWEVSPDKRTYTFELRDDVKWHDGQIFSSADVEATFKKIMELRKRSPRDKESPFTIFNNIESFKAIDQKTFTILLYKPNYGFLYELDFGILPVSAIEASKNLKDEQAVTIVGTGPYKLKGRDSDSIILIKNEDYFKQKPYIDEVSVRYYPETTPLKEAFEKHEVDLVSFAPQDWDIYQGMKEVYLLQSPSTYFEFMALNVNNLLFKDAKVRQAILMGIDRERILQDTTLGRGIIIDGPILPYSWAFNSQIQHLAFNPKKAEHILEEAGWKDEDGDNIREKYINGKKHLFEFELLVNTANIPRYQAASQIQKNLGDIGISVKIINSSWEELKTKVMSKKFAAALMGWKLSVNPDLSFMFGSSEIKGGYNFVSYSNPQLDELLAEAKTLEGDQKELLYKAQEIISKDLPYLFLYSPNKLVALSKRLKGVKPHPINVYSNICEWWVE